MSVLEIIDFPVGLESIKYVANTKATINSFSYLREKTAVTKSAIHLFSHLGEHLANQITQPSYNFILVQNTHAYDARFFIQI